MTVLTRTSLFDRVAAAPISWGVCEMPGWGHQLPVQHVLSDMASFGFTHTELGSLGYLPTEPAQLKAVLGDHDLTLLGGFVPLILHDPKQATQTLEEAGRWAELLSSAGGAYFVTCAVSDQQNWRQAPLRSRQWRHVCEMLTDIDELVATFGLTQAVHPHVGSLIENDVEIAQLINDSHVSVVLDTAHFTLGGTDVVDFARLHHQRVALVHLKDVANDVAQRLANGDVSFMAAVQQGLFPPLGQGNIAIGDVIGELEATGRELWYVLEQDAALNVVAGVGVADSGAVVDSGDGADDVGAAAAADVVINKAADVVRTNISESLSFLRSYLPAGVGS